MSAEEQERDEEREPQETQEPRQEQAPKPAVADANEPSEREPGGVERGAAPAEGRRRQMRRRRVCAFCVDGVSEIDYKDPVKLRRYISDRARIEPRRKTGTCAKHQRWLSVALKRARHLALLPYTPEHIRVTGVFASRK